LRKVEAKSICFLSTTQSWSSFQLLHYLPFNIPFLFNRLWDHLASNLDLYVQPQDTYMDEAPKTKPTEGEQSGKNESHLSNAESEREKYNKLSRSRHNWEWKGLVRDAVEPPPLRSSDIERIHFEEKPYRKDSRAKRSPSPRPSFQRKRGRPDEHENKKVWNIFFPEYKMKFSFFLNLSKRSLLEMYIQT